MNSHDLFLYIIIIGTSCQAQEEVESFLRQPLFYRLLGVYEDLGFTMNQEKWNGGCRAAGLNVEP